MLGKEDKLCSGVVPERPQRQKFPNTTLISPGNSREVPVIRPGQFTTIEGTFSD